MSKCKDSVFKRDQTDLSITRWLCSPKELFAMILVQFITSVPSGVTSFILGFLSLWPQLWRLPLLCLMRRRFPESIGLV